MQMLEDGTPPLLEVFERLEANASPNSVAFFSYVVAHERAIARFAQLERTGRHEESLEPIDSLIAN